MIYQVLSVSRADSHPAASRVDDESMVIVQVKGYPELWWPAYEFFLIEDIKEFEVRDAVTA